MIKLMMPFVLDDEVIATQQVMLQGTAVGIIPQKSFMKMQVRGY